MNRPFLVGPKNKKLSCKAFSYRIIIYKLDF